MPQDYCLGWALILTKRKLLYASIVVLEILPQQSLVHAVDPKSRPKVELETENLLESRGVNSTSIRPVYIYGPLNYNPVEERFFHRLKAGRPIPIPSSRIHIT